jgi:hypothetical protein
MDRYVTFAKVGGSFNADHYKRIKYVSFFTSLLKWQGLMGSE